MHRMEEIAHKDTYPTAKAQTKAIALIHGEGCLMITGLLSRTKQASVHRRQRASDEPAMDLRMEKGETRVGGPPIKGTIDVGPVEVRWHPERNAAQFFFLAFALIVSDEAALHEIRQGIIPNRSPGESMKEGH